MGRVALMALLMILLTTDRPSHAQESRTLLDATIRVVPGDFTGHCLLLDAAGTLDVSLQRMDSQDDGIIGPPMFSLGPARIVPPGPDAPPEIVNQPATSIKTAMSMTAQDRLYCYSLRLASTPAIDTMPARERVAQFRFVALKLTFSPAQP